MKMLVFSNSRSCLELGEITGRGCSYSSYAVSYVSVFPQCNGSRRYLTYHILQFIHCIVYCVLSV